MPQYSVQNISFFFERSGDGLIDSVGTDGTLPGYQDDARMLGHKQDPADAGKNFFTQKNTCRKIKGNILHVKTRNTL